MPAESEQVDLTLPLGLCDSEDWVSAARRLAEAIELAAALELLQGLSYAEWDVVDTDAGECLITGREEVERILDRDADDEAIVAKFGDELVELTELQDREQLLRWVTLVRPLVLERQADDLNYASDTMGSTSHYIVVANRFVTDKIGVVHRDLLARAPRPSSTVTVHLRTRARGRRRRRSASTSRRSARSPDRADDPDPEPDLVLPLAEAAA